MLMYRRVECPPLEWVGAGVIWLDTGFDLRRMLAAPKLMAKLSVLAVLLANAAVLHWWAFPRLLSVQRPGRLVLAGICISGAVSTTSWVYATFLGVARPLAVPMGYGGSMTFYALCLMMATAVSLSWMRKRVFSLMQMNRRDSPPALASPSLRRAA